jgi:hypothetical protein
VVIGVVLCARCDCRSRSFVGNLALARFLSKLTPTQLKRADSFPLDDLCNSGGGGGAMNVISVSPWLDLDPGTELLVDLLSIILVEGESSLPLSLFVSLPFEDDDSEREKDFLLLRGKAPTGVFPMELTCKRF